MDETYFKQIVGCLMYIITTKPDLQFVVSLIARFMANPTEMHYQVAKRVLKYLKGTINFGILLKEEELENWWGLQIVTMQETLTTEKELLTMGFLSMVELLLGHRTSNQL